MFNCELQATTSHTLGRHSLHREMSYLNILCFLFIRSERHLWRVMDFEIRWKPGKSNPAADYLSRMHQKASVQTLSVASKRQVMEMDLLEWLDSALGFDGIMARQGASVWCHHTCYGEEEAR